jgi:hypothetical protein
MGSWGCVRSCRLSEELRGILIWCTKELQCMLYGLQGQRVVLSAAWLVGACGKSWCGIVLG